MDFVYSGEICPILRGAGFRESQEENDARRKFLKICAKRTLFVGNKGEDLCAALHADPGSIPESMGRAGG